MSDIVLLENKENEILFELSVDGIAIETIDVFFILEKANKIASRLPCTKTENKWKCSIPPELIKENFVKYSIEAVINGYHFTCGSGSLKLITEENIKVKAVSNDTLEKVRRSNVILDKEVKKVEKDRQKDQKEQLTVEDIKQLAGVGYSQTYTTKQQPLVSKVKKTAKTENNTVDQKQSSVIKQTSKQKKERNKETFDSILFDLKNKNRINKSSSLTKKLEEQKRQQAIIDLIRSYRNKIKNNN